MNFIVRRFDCSYGQGDESQTEISTLKRLQHNNIISLFGHYDENNEKIIIYEQASRGTLDQHLRDPTLTWSQRLKICLGVARALSYIHYDNDIIHCDVNSAKIFLDEDWEPKVYGFELSTKYPQSLRHRLLYSRNFGTNYITPKYDVYSFGVILYEVLYGKKPMITKDGGILIEPIDPNLKKQMSEESLRQFKELAYKCLKQQLGERPAMDQIVKGLERVLGLQGQHANLEHSKAVDGGTISNNLMMELLKIPLSEIRQATKEFNDDFLVGGGGFGAVYKAELEVLDIENLSLSEGMCKDKMPKIRRTVAIKRIRSRADSQEAYEMILVFEYVSKGSLSDCLENDGKDFNLTWVQRLQICLDIARGIRYLHFNMDGKPRIIHRDIKSDNILLDENLKAKIADFGLSKFRYMKQSVASAVFTNIIAGTPLYRDPEYESSGKYNTKSDIYSFGVVLFEVLSGRMAYHSIYMEETEKGLAQVARRRYNDRTLKELIDPKIMVEDDHIFTLNRGPNEVSLNVFSKIAHQCLAETQISRPTIDVVIKELKNALKLQGEAMVLSRFPLGYIESATKEFAETHCIGSNTNSMLYKAEVDHSGNNSLLATEGENNGVASKKRVTVAMKRITNRKDSQEKKEFFEELETRACNRHPNVVSLIGFCDEVDELILVYDYTFERSLDDYLKSVDNVHDFTWTHRLHLCLEIAHGLNHLHTKMVNQQTIIHANISSADILLDKSLKAKIAYFGISKLHLANQETVMKVYEDPEHERTSKPKRKSSIYSFGVVIFEIFCGKLAYDRDYMNKNDKGLAPIARQCFQDGTIEIIMDPKLKEETDEDIFNLNRRPNKDSVETFSKIAYQCLGKAAERPTMEIVIKELEKALNFHEFLVRKLQISRKDIESATNKFSKKNCVGSGRFWKAYKGELPFSQDNANANANASGSTTILAKRWENFHSNFGEGDHQFRTEVNILFRYNHENVIGLVGYCNEVDEKIIVYEDMSNGSLDKYLKDASLTWMKRLVICIDIANGLDFLHQGDVKLKKVVHRNITSASILLNSAWRAKISNLEMSSLDLLHQNTEHIVNDDAYPTLGYLDPQYNKQGFLTEKSDIYSFGVVLFEILCGRLAWEDHSQFLGPLAKSCYEEGKLDEIVFDGIKEHIGRDSLFTFADIAYQCLQDESEQRPTAHEVVIQLKKALDAQKDDEIWETELPEDYKEIILMSKNPEMYSREKREDLYDTFSKGVLIQKGKVWVSLRSDGERNEMISASQFLYKNYSSHKWHYVPESRFDKIAEISNISNLNIQINIRSRFLSSGVNYGVHLVFKFCGARKYGAKPVYVNLTYKMGNETLHAYFATWREDEWMTIELYRFLSHDVSDATDFEFLLESFSRCYCPNRAIYIEGVEIRAIENVKLEENKPEVQQVITDPTQQLQTNDVPSYICSSKPFMKLFKWRKKMKQNYMLSADEALCDSFNAKLFKLKPSTESRFQKVVELLPTPVFRIKCKIKSEMLLENTEYSCYLVFKLSEKRCGLHCPVIVRDLHQRENKLREVFYFRSPRPWNKHDIKWVPQERDDGWMEVCVWKFKSDHKVHNDRISMNLIFVTYEGTMSGLIICGLEFRPM